MTKFVRVIDTRTGHRYSVTAAKAKHAKHLTVLPLEAAVDINGAALPPTCGEVETDKAVIEQPEPSKTTKPKTTKE